MIEVAVRDEPLDALEQVLVAGDVLRLRGARADIAAGAVFALLVRSLFKAWI